VLLCAVFFWQGRTWYRKEEPMFDQSRVIAPYPAPPRPLPAKTTLGLLETQQSRDKEVVKLQRRVKI
jgi:hypothetical protein